MVTIEIDLTNKDIQLIANYRKLSDHEKLEAEEDYPDVHALAELFMRKFNESEE